MTTLARLAPAFGLALGLAASRVVAQATPDLAGDELGGAPSDLVAGQEDGGLDAESRMAVILSLPKKGLNTDAVIGSGRALMDAPVTNSSATINQSSSRANSATIHQSVKR